MTINNYYSNWVQGYIQETLCDSQLSEFVLWYRNDATVIKMSIVQNQAIKTVLKRMWANVADTIEEQEHGITSLTFL